MGELWTAISCCLLWTISQAVTRPDTRNTNTYLSDRLMTHILTGYQKEVRPRNDSHSPVITHLELSLRQIIELNEPKQTLSTNVWIRMYWSDCRITWNSSQFNGIQTIILPSTSIWTPDLTLYDNSAEKAMSGTKVYRVSITKDGFIRFQFPELLTSLCRIDTTYFPFDKQFCNLTFGSWIYDGFGIDIFNVSDHGTLDNYKEHVEWSIIKLSAMRISVLYSGIPYPSVIFGLQIRRKPLFYIINLLFPCILMSSVAVLGFLLPADSGEKVSLQVMVILSLSVFQLIILDLMPPSSETFPLISAYFASSMVLVGLSLLMTVITLNVYFRGHQGHIVSTLARTLCISWLGRLLCVHDPRRKKPSFTQKVTCGLVKFKRRTSLFAIADNDTNSLIDNHCGSVPIYMESVLKSCQRITTTLEGILKCMAEKAEEQRIKEDWRLIGTTLDRFFLLLFCVFSLLLVSVFAIKFSEQ